MRRAFGLAVLAGVAVTCLVSAQKEPPYNPAVPQKLPEYNRRLPTLLDDDAHLLLTHLTNDYDGSQQTANASSEDVDVFCGASSLKVTAQQRHSMRIAGWQWKIVPKPTTDGEYRYIRFAWKKTGGDGIMIQLHDQGRSWVARYYAGKNVGGWQPAKEVSKEVPKEWTVVTRDLYEDFAKANGGTLTISGIAFTAFDGQHALFDHLMLGRSIAELDAATDTALGKGKADATLDPKYREALWEDLFEKDRVKSGGAVRGLLTAAPEAVPLIADRLPPTTQSPEEVKERAKKIGTYISQLGGEADFDTRLAAEEALDKLGPLAEPAVRAALTSADPEVRYRANRLMRRLKLEEGESSLAAARAGRVVRILERANTADAKALLKKMTDGVYGTEYLEPSAAALARMK
jgi:hypothetical protein